MTALGLPGLSLSTLTPPLHSEPADSKKTRRLILVVEDDQMVRDALGLMLEDDYDVLYAADGPPALEIASVRRPDVVLLDLLLTRMHGLEVLARLNAAARGIRVIVVTIAGDTDTVVEAMRLGAVDFVAKPYEEEVLLDKIREALGERPARFARWSPATPAEPEAAATGSMLRQRCLVLVAQPGIAATLALALEAHFATQMAADGIRAVRVLGSGTLQCVLCDEGALAASGEAFVRAAREHYPTLRVALLAGTRAVGAAGDRTRVHDERIPRDAQIADVVRHMLLLCWSRSPADVPQVGPGVHVGAAMEYLRDHYSEAITATDVARAVAVSRSHLARRFEAELGHGIGRYLTRLRVEVAKFYLLNGSRKIEEVAALSGFKDASHLSRVFRKHTGHRPRTYRKLKAF